VDPIELLYSQYCHETGVSLVVKDTWFRTKGLEGETLRWRSPWAREHFNQKEHKA
jgi:hypothetical protein